MKFKLFVIFIFIMTLNVWAQENLCSADISKICDVERSEYRIKELREINEDAFSEVLKSTEMEDLICKNFDLKQSNLSYDFLWNRSCWDWKYRRSVKKMDIKTCDDFVKADATKNFVLNCKQIINDFLINKYYSSLHSKTKEIMTEVKERYLNAFKSEPYYPNIYRLFRSITDMTHLETNLSTYTSSFKSTKKTCSKVKDFNFCSIYRESDKKYLSLGAHAFYSEKDLEVFIASKLAELMIEKVRYFENHKLQNIYLNKLQGLSHHWKLENIIARSMSKDEINISTLKAMILGKYFSRNERYSELIENESLDLICPEKIESLKKNKGNYYYNSFTRLHPEDEMKLMLCVDKSY